MKSADKGTDDGSVETEQGADTTVVSGVGDELRTVTDSPAAVRRERRDSGQGSVGSADSSSSPTGPSDAEAIAKAVGRRTLLTRLGTDVRTGEKASRDALFSEEVDRMRTFAALSGIFCLVLLILLPFVGGNAVLRWIVWSGALFSALSGIWLYRALRDRSRYNQRIVNISALASVGFTYVGVYFLGIHSPLAMLALVGIYYFCRSQKRLAAFAVYASCAFLQGAGALAILLGWVDDPGLMRAEDTPMRVRVITQVLVQLAYLGTFLLARSSRGGTLRAMDQLIAAQKEAQAREAAFQEVRQDLDRVLEVGGAGQYTGKIVGGVKLDRIIGRGAMGEVYAGVMPETGDLVAVKVLHPHVLAKKFSVERFLREARAAGAMRSRHAVRVLSASSRDDAVPHIVMERLTGEDLAQRLRKERRLPQADLIALVQQIGSVLDEARLQGIVHRDVKPQNLFWARGPSGRSEWKLLDFGASKLAENSGTLTAGRVVGTPSYMSPEQAQGLDVDHRADLYSLAAIAYRCVAGRPPFSGKDLPTTLFQVVYGTPPPPSMLADVDPVLDLVVAVGMAKRPEARFPSAAEFSKAFEAALRGQISDALRSHANALLQEQPWGMSPRPSDATTGD